MSARPGPRSETARDRRCARCVRSRLPPQCLEHDGIYPFDPVDALLQVLGAGPGEERFAELSLVAELRQALAQFCGELAVDVDPEPLRRLAEDRIVQAVEAAQLLEPTLVVLDA